MADLAATIASAEASRDAVIEQIAEGRVVVRYRINGREVESAKPHELLRELNATIRELKAELARTSRSIFRPVSLKGVSRRGTT